MNNISILDCTLRDGGYINQWEFGKNNIKKIFNSLIDSNIDIVECGFLTEKKEHDENTSLFNTVEKIFDYLPTQKKNTLTVVMINYGEYSISNLPKYEEGSIDGIRLAFHKKDMEDALKIGQEIIDKGYKLFIQPMVSISYTDEEFINLIKKTNHLKPYAFYIVDSFGVMKKRDLMRLYYLVDHNLADDIIVGYHSHNNIQLAYSNAQNLADLNTKRKIIIDTSVFGMGRGAGNLNTELFIEYLNESDNKKYKIKPLLKIIDQVLNPIYSREFWGYSLPHYVSAINNCHPNYASYLDNKNTLTIENINEILSSMSSEKRNRFDNEYIEKQYIQYQNNKITDYNAKKKLKKNIGNKTVVIIAPGSSINEEYNNINHIVSSTEYITISINFKPKNYKFDYVFVSNLRRYEDLVNEDKDKFIKTSNINNVGDTGYIVNYFDLLNDVESVEDNAGMMLIKLLIDLGVNKIKLAGFDGYSHVFYENFADKNLAFMKNSDVMDSMNSGMEQVLEEYSEQINIEFITRPKFVKLGVMK